MTIDKAALRGLQVDLQVQVNAWRAGIQTFMSNKVAQDVLMAIYYYQKDPSPETEAVLKRDIDQYGYQHYGVFK